MEERTHCDICRSTRLTQAFSYPTHRVVRCENCGTLSRREVFDEDECKTLYESEYFVELQKDFFFTNVSLRERAFRGKLDLIGRHATANGDLLDVGCAIGTFLRVARDMGWRPTGVEFSAFAADVARKETKLPVLTGTLPAQHLPEACFDVVTLWDVVDHSESPSSLVREVWRVLRPGGLIAMDTFMEDALLFQLAHATYRATGGVISRPSLKAHPIHHSHYFSRTTFRHLLESQGFEVLFTEGSNLDAATVSLGWAGKAVVALFNRLSALAGREMEMLIIGRKKCSSPI